MFNRILLPLDGSVMAERVIPHAELFSRIFGSKIVLLQILDPGNNHESMINIDPLSWQIRKTEAEKYLNGIAGRILKDLGRSDTMVDKNKTIVECALREGKPAENIVNFAQSEKIDLVILSTHGISGLSRWNLSSVTQKVIEQIYLPLLIIRSYEEISEEKPFSHYRRILMPVDSSKRAEYSLTAGIALAQGELSLVEAGILPNIFTNKVLLLAAVIKPPEIPIPEPYPDEIEQLSRQLMDVSHQAANYYLNEMKERLPVETDICVLENCSVSSAIQEIAKKEEDVDLVVLCAHGRTGESTWPYGSVARNYIEHGNKAVLIIQDIHRSQVKPTAAAIAAEKTGSR
jgi:nucleotide-binding universal stress UspA family protein